VYLADVPATSPLSRRSRNDIEFSGSVSYRIPSAKDPTTDTVCLETESLRWDNAGAKFRSESPYRMAMAQSGKPPVSAVGDGFAVSQDLKTWNVRHGGLGMGHGGDMRGQNSVRREAVVAEAARLERAEDGQQPGGQEELPVAAPGAQHSAPSRPRSEIRDTAAGPRKYAVIPPPKRVSAEQTTADLELIRRAVAPAPSPGAKR
jgi:hypothetical protein